MPNRRPDPNDRRVYQLLTERNAIVDALGDGVRAKGRSWTLVNAWKTEPMSLARLLAL